MIFAIFAGLFLLCMLGALIIACCGIAYQLDPDGKYGKIWKVLFFSGIVFGIVAIIVGLCGGWLI